AVDHHQDVLRADVEGLVERDAALIWTGVFQITPHPDRVDGAANLEPEVDGRYRQVTGHLRDAQGRNVRQDAVGIHRGRSGDGCAAAQRAAGAAASPRSPRP